MRLPSLPVLLAVWSASATIATAKEFRLPTDKPVASVTVTDDWRPEENPRGLRAQSKDGEMSLTVGATTDPKEMSAIIDEADARLKARKVTLDRTTRQDHKFKINGFPAEELVYQGRDEAGPVFVTFTFVTVRDAALVFTYWATHAGDQNHLSELGVMFDSIKEVKPSAAVAPVAAPAAKPQP